MKQELNTEYIKDFVKARNLYLVALAINETNIKICKDAAQKVINENVFFIWDRNKSGKEVYKRLTSPDSDYLLKDHEFISYLQLVHAERLKAGFKADFERFNFEEWNVSADAESRPLLRKAEEHLINTGLSLLPEPLKSDLESIKKQLKYNVLHRDKLINIFCSLDLSPWGYPLQDSQEVLKEVLN